MPAISPQTARARVHDEGEIAFLDVREAGQFIEGHPLFAIPCPYSVLELEIARLVPRHGVPIVLCDGGDGIADRAAGRLRDMGYGKTDWIEGGVPAWAAAGLPLYKGVNVPSKVLGELAEQVWHPQSLCADAVDTRRARGEIEAIFDARPPSEHRKMRVPGAICLPNGELAHRIEAVGDAAAGPLVITCAGRTRGIIGAIGLRLSGHDGPVAVLENGTQGWALSGRTLERGAAPAPLPPLTVAQAARSRARADAMAARFDLPFLSALDAERATRAEDRSTFVFDLRSPAEADLIPLPGARRCDGVQLVQATDQFVGIRHARLILCCDTGLRSVIAAFWLRQLGYEVHVIRICPNGALPCFPVSEASQPTAPTLPADALQDSDLLVDLRASSRFLESHGAGAKWSIRPRVRELDAGPGPRRLVLIEDRAGIGALYSRDAREAGFPDVRVLRGGHAALVAAGHPVQPSCGMADADRIDFPFFVHDRHDGNMEASRRYLAWETGLIGQLDTAERAAFRLTQP